MNIESKLFDFDAAQGDSGIVEYFGITLKNPIGQFPAGHTFHEAKLDADKGTLSFYVDNVLVARYSVELTVTKDLLNEE